MIWPWNARSRSIEVHLGAEHAASVTCHLICISQLPEDIALPIQHILLLALIGITLEFLLLSQLGLAVLAVKFTPELRIMRVTFPLFSQLFDIFV